MKNIKRRLISFILALSMVLGMVPGIPSIASGQEVEKESLALKENIAVSERELPFVKENILISKNELPPLKENILVSQNDLPSPQNNLLGGAPHPMVEKNHLPVYNEKILNQIMTDFIRVEESPYATSLTGSIGPLFRLIPKSTDNLKKNGGFNPKEQALFIDSEIYNIPRERTNIIGGDLRFQFKDNEYNSAWLNSLTESGDVKMRVGADFPLYQQKGHSTWIATISKNKGYSNIIYGEGTKGRGYFDSDFADIDLSPYLHHYSLVMKGVDNHKSSGSNSVRELEISKPWVALMDNAPPKINSITLEGKKLTLNINEKLRYANETIKSSFEGMVLTFAVADRGSGVEDEKQDLKAIYKASSEKSFEFEIQGSLIDKNIVITRIKAVSFNYGKHDFDVYGIKVADEYYKSKGGYPPGVMLDSTSANKIHKMTTLKEAVNSPLTDVGGNEFIIPTNQDLIPFGLVIDTLAPKITGINISGPGMTATNNLDKDKWPDNVDRSSLFIGPTWKWLDFYMETDEYVDIKNAIVTFNLKNKDGSPVTSRDGSLDSGGKDYGRKAIVFRSLFIHPGMYTTDGQPIHPVKIELGEGGYIRDWHGNDLKLDDINDMLPNQKLYLDTSPPKIFVSGNSEGRQTTFKLEFSDVDTSKNEVEYSGYAGKDAKIGFSGSRFPLITNGKPDSKYQYVINNSPTPPTYPDGTDPKNMPKFVELGDRGIQWIDYTIDQPTLYVHLKFLGDESILSTMSLYAKIEDYAGNEGYGQINNVHVYYDEIAPTITLKSIKPIYGSTNAQVEAVVNIKDLSFLESFTNLEYSWDDGESTKESFHMGHYTMGKDFKITSGDYDKSGTAKLKIKAKDNSGNEKIAEYSIDFEMNKPKATYSFESDRNVLYPKPKVTITGGVNELATGDVYTRVTLTAGKDRYVRMLKTGETSDLFDFEGDWYKVETNYNNKYTKVEVGNPKNYYGPVNISMENVIAKEGSYNLTPEVGKSSVGDGVTNGSYSIDDIGTVNYAPVLDNVYKINPYGFHYKDKDGTDIDLGSSTTPILRYNESMAGTSISFKVENTKWPKWNVRDVDFEKSYMVFVDKDGNELVKSGLSNSEDQIFVVPSVYSLDTPAGNENPEEPEVEPETFAFETGNYQLKVYVVQKDSDPKINTPIEGQSTHLVLDRIEPSNNGLWYYEHKFNIDELFEFSHGDPLLSRNFYRIPEADKPFASMTISFKDHTETMRNDLYSIETLGVDSTELIIGELGKTQDFAGKTIGQVAGIRAWNRESTGWKDLAFEKGDRLNYIPNGGITINTTNARKFTINADSIVDSLVGSVADGSIKVTQGENNICYEVKMENGIISPIYEFKIFINSETPELGMSINPEITNNQYLQERDPKAPTLLRSADVQINKAYSLNGKVEIDVLQKGRINKNSYGTIYYDNDRESSPYSMGDENKEADVINVFRKDFKEADYNDNNTSTIVGGNVKENKTNASTIFVAVDEAGGMTMLIPQFKRNSYTDGNGNDVYTKYALESRMYGEFSGYTHGGLFWVEKSDYLDMAKSTVTFFKQSSGEDIEGITLPAINPPLPNAVGFMGLTEDGKGDLEFKMGKVFGSEMYFDVVFNSVSIYGERVDYKTKDRDDMVAVASNCNYDLNNIEMSLNDNGVQLKFPNSSTEVKLVGGSNDYSHIHILPIFKNGTHTATFTDVVGSTFKYEFEVNYDEFKTGPEISFSNIEITSKPVTVTFTEPTENLTVTGEAGKVEITGNGTKEVTALVSESSDLTVTWGDGKSRKVSVNNIQPLELGVRWSYYKDEKLAKNRVIGHLTATLMDPNWSIIDVNTGELPKYTFYPNGETSHTFSVVSGEAGAVPMDYTITIPDDVELIEPSIPVGEEADILAPGMQFRAFIDLSGKGNLEDQKKILRIYEGAEELYDFNKIVYEGYETYTSMSSFLTDLGWGNRYSFLVDTSDYSPVKLIIKNGLNAANPKYTDQSETVTGVSVSRNTLSVMQNASFTLFAVDSSDNCTGVNMVINNAGTAKVPKLVKTYPEAGKVRVYLLPDNGEFLELKLTDKDAEVTVGGTYDGKYYKDYDANGEYTLHYSYKYQGKVVEGSLTIKINEIDQTGIDWISPIEWSPNKNLPTNRDVIANLKFSKNISSVSADKATGAKIQFSGKDISIRYEKNSEALVLTVTAENGKTTTASLGKVDNIDKISPIVTFTLPTTGPFINPKGGRSASVEFTSNEKVTFQEFVKQIGEEKLERQGTKFKRTLEEEGEYTYHFVDMAGNITTKTFTISGLIKEALKLEFSINADGSGGVVDPSNIFLSIGSLIYVKANRKCKISLNNGEEKQYDSGWIGFTITKDVKGLTPSIYAIDVYGNSASGEFSKIDVNPPVISLKNKTVTISFDRDIEEIRDMLINNLNVYDSMDESPSVVVDFEKPSNPGFVSVTYTATDRSGNSTSIKGNLRLIDGADIKVTLNGEHVERDSIIWVMSNSSDLKIDLGTEQAYSVTYKAGMKTVGQMKIGSTDIVRNCTNSDVIKFNLNEKGYYTICIVTQERDYFCFIINVK